MSAPAAEPAGTSEDQMDTIDPAFYANSLAKHEVSHKVGSRKPTSEVWTFVVMLTAVGITDSPRSRPSITSRTVLMSR